MTTTLQANRSSQKGNSIIEFALFAPFLFLVLLAAVDLGIYTFAFISVENAARAAALRNSSGMESASDQETACAIVMDSLRGLPNVSLSLQSTCNSPPVRVTSVRCDSTVPCSGTATSVDGSPATAVTVTYNIPPVFRLPIPGPTTITRTSQMKVRNLQ